MNPTETCATDPIFPPELEREIVETTAVLHPLTMPTPASGALRSHLPLLSRVLMVAEGFDLVHRPMDDDDVLALRAMRVKPASFFAENVHFSAADSDLSMEEVSRPPEYFRPINDTAAGPGASDTAHPPVEDLRFVSVVYENMWHDWEEGVRGETDFWAAETFIARKRRSEIDGALPRVVFCVSHLTPQLHVIRWNGPWGGYQRRRRISTEIMERQELQDLPTMKNRNDQVHAASSSSPPSATAAQPGLGQFQL
ncbi:hypothetical protein DFH07DRAFT_1024917 [Mycena maculata]|uniref:Uncharacterized protein n=1 Tax=Mycena maculata TaxID=230809 RepID=A0AAD7J7Z8_9AGAR|nr:hypothetical protein DFH07DRAFT_1024917 [Mycena maculata]